MYFPFFASLISCVAMGAVSAAEQKHESPDTRPIIHLVDRSCTAFCLKNNSQVVFGTNYDNQIHEGLLFVNKKNVSKFGWKEDDRSGKQARWTSKYGSISFNLVMYHSAWGGMNEAGLMISTLYLPNSQPPAPDERPWLDSGSWVQYVLDNCSTVQEVMDSDAHLRISDYADHYLVCDRRGDCVSIEFIDGKIVYHTGKDLPVKCLANNTYAESVNSWQKQDAHIQVKDVDYLPSLERFRITADRVQSFEPNELRSAVDYAFEVLSEVGGSITQWSIVFDAKQLRIYFHTKINPRKRFIDLKRLDFSCTKPVMMLDVHEEISGDITQAFRGYSSEAHRKHAARAWSRWGGDVTQDSLQGRIQHLESFPCCPLH